MKYIICFGVVYRVSDEKYKEIIRRIARFEMTFLGDFGELWGEPVVGEIVDIGRMTQKEAQAIIEGFNDSDIPTVS